MPLFEHTLHLHVSTNSNETHKVEFNQRVAVTITRATGTMSCAIEQIAAYLTAQDEVLAKLIEKHDD